MTEEISFDPARKVPIKFRINRQANKRFVFTENGAELDITGWTWEFFIKRYPGDLKKTISLTLNNGLSFTVYETNSLDVFFTALQTDIQEGQYYWELVRTDIQKTWLNGWAVFSYGPVDNATD